MTKDFLQDLLFEFKRLIAAAEGKPNVVIAIGHCKKLAEQLRIEVEDGEK